MEYHAKLFAFGFAFILSACTTTTPLQGNWGLLVSGKVYSLEISYIGSEEVIINSTFADINGKYRSKNNQLILITPAQPRITGIIFEKNTEGEWIIIQAPPAARLTTPLFGAKMVRQ